MYNKIINLGRQLNLGFKNPLLNSLAHTIKSDITLHHITSYQNELVQIQNQGVWLEEVSCCYELEWVL